MWSKINNPKISVIMPNYNGMPYLKDAVKSILGQTFRNFEFIIIDDKSTDNSLKYLEKIKDPRVKLLKNKKNLGVALSLNKGLKAARGQYIARMDADDISLPRRFQKQLDYLNRNEQIALCGTWANIIDERGRKIGEKKYPTDPKKVKNAISWYNPIVHPTFMGKREFFEALKGYRAAYDYAEDYDLISRARTRFSMANLATKLLLWRLQSQRRSWTSMGKMDEIDLKIKLESMKRDGFAPSSALAYLKKLVIVFILPQGLKYRLAVILKRP